MEDFSRRLCLAMPNRSCPFLKMSLFRYFAISLFCSFSIIDPNSMVLSLTHSGISQLPLRGEAEGLWRGGNFICPPSRHCALGHLLVNDVDMVALHPSPFNSMTADHKSIRRWWAEHDVLLIIASCIGSWAICTHFIRCQSVGDANRKGVGTATAVRKRWYFDTLLILVCLSWSGGGWRKRRTACNLFGYRKVRKEVD